MAGGHKKPALISTQIKWSVPNGQVLLANSADNILKHFSYFSQKKTGFGIKCKLSPLEKICMKYQTCFLKKSIIFPRKQDLTFNANQKTGLDVSCKSPPLDILHEMSKCFLGKCFNFSSKQDLRFHTKCMKCQTYFLEEIRKNVSVCCLLNFLPRMLAYALRINPYQI